MEGFHLEEEDNVNALVRLNRAAAVARTLRRASANIATVGKAMGQATRLQQVLGRGSFLHDLVVLANPRAGPGIRMAAARRLARYDATHNMIFFEARWLQLEDASLTSEVFLSQVRDVDYAEAVTQLQSAMTRLQVNMQTSSVVLNLSLLDFLR